MNRLAFLVLATVLLAPSAASAQIGSEWTAVRTYTPSPENFTLELGLGIYRPNLEPAFTTAFGGDLGPMLHAELDVHLVRIPYIGPIGIGVAFGWAEWTGTARAVDAGATNVGNTGLSLIPLSLLGVLRIDGLARELSVPVILTAKLGPEFGYFQTGTSGSTDAEGFAFGLRWAAQVGLELDFLDQRAANRLDQEWGINHTVIYFELFGSTMGQMGGTALPLGTDLAWTAGLQLTF